MSTMGSYPWPEATVFAATAVYARALHEAHRDRCEALVPELVAALRRILHIAKSDAPTAFADVVQEARDAIAKAEGKDTSA